MATYQAYLLVLCFISYAYCASVKFPPRRLPGLPLHGNLTMAREPQNIPKMTPLHPSQIPETTTKKFLRMPSVKTISRQPETKTEPSDNRREKLPSRRRMPSMASLQKGSNTTRRYPAGNAMEKRFMTVEDSSEQDLGTQKQKEKIYTTIPSRQTSLRRNPARGNPREGSTRMNRPENTNPTEYKSMEKSDEPQVMLANINIPIRTVSPETHPHLFKAIAKAPPSDIDAAASDILEIIYPVQSEAPTETVTPKIEHSFQVQNKSTHEATEAMLLPKNITAEVSEMTFLDSTNITDLPSEVINTIAEAKPITSSTTVLPTELSSRKDKVFVVYAQGIEDYLKEMGKTLDSLARDKVYPTPHSDILSSETNKKKTGLLPDAAETIMKTLPEGQEKESGMRNPEILAAPEVVTVHSLRENFSTENKTSPAEDATTKGKIKSLLENLPTEKKIEVFSVELSENMRKKEINQSDTEHTIEVITPKHTSNTVDVEKVSSENNPEAAGSEKTSQQEKVFLEVTSKKTILVMPVGSFVEKKMKIVPVGTIKEEQVRNTTLVPEAPELEDSLKPKLPELEGESFDDLDTGESDPPSVYITIPDRRPSIEPLPRTHTEVRHQTSTVRVVQNPQQPEISSLQKGFTPDDTSNDSHRKPFLIYVPPENPSPSILPEPRKPQYTPENRIQDSNSQQYVYVLTKKEPEQPTSPEYVYLLTKKGNERQVSPQNIENKYIADPEYIHHPQENPIQQQTPGNNLDRVVLAPTTNPKIQTQHELIPHNPHLDQNPAKIHPQSDLHEISSIPYPQNSPLTYSNPQKTQPPDHSPQTRPFLVNQPHQGDFNIPKSQNQKINQPLSTLPQGHYSSNNFPYPQQEIPKINHPLRHLALPTPEANPPFVKDSSTYDTQLFQHLSGQNNQIQNKAYIQPPRQGPSVSQGQAAIHNLSPIRNNPFEPNHSEQNAAPKTISIRNEVPQTYNGQVSESQATSGSMFGGLFSFLG